jgi:TonB family protein
MMNQLLIHMIKTAFCIAVFYMAYTALLSRDTMYARNRAFILFSVITSLVLPFITIETSRPVSFLFFGKTLSEVLITGSSRENVMGAGGIFAIEWPKILFIIYIAGLLLSTARLMLNLAELFMLIMRKKAAGTNIIRFHGLNTAGFSAIGYIFINSRLSESDAGEILKHEQNHLAHYHFFDVLFIEIVKVLQWFNPFIHLFDRSLRAVHEYQADEGCIKSGFPVLSYQQLLMNQVFKASAFDISNSFSNPTLIKKRMIMMTKKRSTTLANLKILIVLPVIAIMLVAFSSCKGKAKPAESATEKIAPPAPPPSPPVDADKKVVLGDAVPKDAPPPPPPPQPFNVKDGDTTWNRVDVMPVFPGGDAALLKFIANNTNYPQESKSKGVQGKVIVRFLVEPNCNIDKISVLKGVAPDIDAEAVRVVSKLPKFEKPGIEKGKPVPVWYMLPISFTLN